MAPGRVTPPTGGLYVGNHARALTPARIRSFPMTIAFQFRAAAALAVALLPGALQAQDAQPARIRGTVEAVAADTLTVKTREGDTAEIELDDGWKVVGVTSASMDDIGPGSYLGIASLPGADGRQQALEVLIFPAEMKGAGEGQFPWDLQPDSMMTNASVSSVEKTDGNVLTMSYKGEESEIVVPENAPVVTFGPADTDDLAEGKSVFVPGKRAADGSLRPRRSWSRPAG